MRYRLLENSYLLWKYQHIKLKFSFDISYITISNFFEKFNC